MILRNSSKLFIAVLIMAVVIIVVLGALFVKQNFIKDESTVQDPETEILSDSARESLKNGSCSEEELQEIQKNATAYSSTSSEEKSLKDQADCYVLRGEYEMAKEAFEELHAFYVEDGNSEFAESTEEIIKNIEYFIVTPKESEEEVDTGEPLAI